MRSAEIITESTNKREWTFYHGTASEVFHTFEPKNATKGEAYWNPLGNGMYATNNKEFARSFGHNLYKVIIPIGSTYKRISQDVWAYSTGPGLITRTLRAAMKKAGYSYDAWDSGEKAKGPDVKKMNREEMIAFIIDAYSHMEPDELENLKVRASEATDDTLRSNVKHKLDYTPRQVDKVKQDAIFNFKVICNQMVRQNAPYTSLVECASAVEMYFNTFDPKIHEYFEDLLPKMSDQLFGKYDFIVFSETESISMDDTWEVVIFNPALQKVVKKEA
jgi:hypothetical protein